MRLPGRQFGPVQGLGRGSPQQAAQAKLSPVPGAIGRLALQATDIATSWMEAETKAEAANGLAKFRAEEMAIRDRLTQDTVVGLKELKQFKIPIPADVAEKLKAGAFPDDAIPMHMVQREYYETITGQLKKKYGAAISSKKGKGIFDTGATQTGMVGTSNITKSFFERRQKHLLDQGKETMAVKIQHGTAITSEFDKMEVEETLDAAVKLGVMRGGEAEIALIKFKADYDFNVANKSIAEALRMRDAEVISIEVDRVMALQTDMTPAQQVKFLASAETAFGKITKLRKADLVIAQDKHMVSGRAAILGEDKDAPDLKTIERDHAAGRLSTPGATSLMNAVMSKNKAKTEKAFKSDDSVMQSLRQELRYIQLSDDDTMTKKQKTEDFINGPLAMARGIMDEGTTKPMINDVDYGKVLTAAQKMGEGPYVSRVYKNTVKSLHRMITGVPPGSSYFSVNKHDALRLGAAMDELNYLVETQANFDPRKWWTKNFTRFSTEKTLETYVKLDPIAQSAIKFKDEEIDFSASITELRQQRIEARRNKTSFLLPHQFDRTVNALMALRDKMYAVRPTPDTSSNSNVNQ